MRKLTGIMQTPWLAALILGHVVFAILLGLRMSGALQNGELAGYDFMLRTRVAQTVDERIVIVAESEADLQRFGHPLPDDVIADTAEKLLAADARVIGFDKYRDRAVEPGTARLERLMRDHANLVWIFQLGDDGKGYIAPPDAVKDIPGRSAFNDNLPDGDGIVRRALLFADQDDQFYYSFATLVSMLYLSAEQSGIGFDENDSNIVHVGDSAIALLERNSGPYANIDAAGYQFLLDYAGMPAAMRHVSLSEVIDDKITPLALRDKIVLVGATTPSLLDYKFTPWSNAVGDSLNGSGGRIYGVELHAYIISQLLRLALDGAKPIHYWSKPGEIAWLWLWTLLGSLSALWLRSAARAIAVAALGGAILYATVHWAFVGGLWLPLLPPMLGWLLSGALITLYLGALAGHQRRQLMNLFARHVSKDVAEAIWREREQFLDGQRPRPMRLTATVLFTDIRGFTSVSENADPGELMDWLNEYMDRMARIVIEHQGVINKYIGDAIMAVFGVPFARAREAEIAADARHAVACALAMREELQRLNREWAAQGRPTIGMRVGIYTGPLVAGSLGSQERLEYTVIGDTVNTASRLESYDKSVAESDCRILVGDQTLRHLDERFESRYVDEVKLKGKDQPLAIHQITGYRTDPSAPDINPEISPGERAKT